MATLRLTLFKSKKLADGKHPIMLVVTVGDYRKYIATSFSTTPTHWKNGAPYRLPSNTIKALKAILREAEKRLSELELIKQDFTVNEAYDFITGKSGNRDRTIKVFLDDFVKHLEETGKIGTARTYKETFKSFFAFLNDDYLKFGALTEEHISGYVDQCRAKGNKDGSISVRVRTIRALYNHAIKKKIKGASLLNSPFRLGGFEMSTIKPTPQKRAITLDQFRKVVNLDLEQYPELKTSHHYFVFSYYARGMNFADLAKLKHQQIEGEQFSYVRSKTGKTIRVSINERLRPILDYFADLVPINSPFVFPIMQKPNMSPKSIDNRIKKMRTMYNKDLKRIATILELPPLTSYVARHSFATNLKHQKTDIGIISDALGHSNAKTTEAYLKSFGSDEIDEAINKLL